MVGAVTSNDYCSFILHRIRSHMSRWLGFQYFPQLGFLYEYQLLSGLPQFSFSTSPTSHGRVSHPGVPLFNLYSGDISGRALRRTRSARPKSLAVYRVQLQTTFCIGHTTLIILCSAYLLFIRKSKPLSYTYIITKFLRKIN